MEQNIKRYSFQNDSGDAQAIVYRVFHGIEVIYTTVHMNQFDFQQMIAQEDKNYALLHYCQEGRLEQEIAQEFFYLMPGDCSIALQNHPKMFQLPLHHYHGITISINLNQESNPLFQYVQSCGYSPLEAFQHICGDASHIVLRNSVIAKQFFEALYKIEEAKRLDYLRMKLPELFYRMKHAKTTLDYYDRNLVSKQQVEFVKNVSIYINEHINDKITIQHLTNHFNVSNTYLQNAFRSVYGMPVISFIRVQKMQEAAQILIHTNDTIEMIAQNFGYENESKFSAAFKKIMGDTPGVYRKEHSKITII